MAEIRFLEQSDIDELTSGCTFVQVVRPGRYALPDDFDLTPFDQGEDRPLPETVVLEPERILAEVGESKMLADLFASLTLKPPRPWGGWRCAMPGRLRLRFWPHGRSLEIDSSFVRCLDGSFSDAEVVQPERLLRWLATLGIDLSDTWRSC